jgi:small-conductance mechanosensitive channel
MENYKLNIIYTLVFIFIFIGIKLIVNKIISKAGKKFNYHSGRIKMTKKIVNFILTILFVGVVIVIWGVSKTEIVYYISTVLTILGVAFFAQWSIISNITSTLIIFFNHPVKIGDSLAIYDKEYPIAGKLNDIGIFFIKIKTDEGKIITIPSNVFMQKVVLKEAAEQ